MHMHIHMHIHMHDQVDVAIGGLWQGLSSVRDLPGVSDAMAIMTDLSFELHDSQQQQHDSQQSVAAGDAPRHADADVYEGYEPRTTANSEAQIALDAIALEYAGELPGEGF